MFGTQKLWITSVDSSSSFTGLPTELTDVRLWLVPPDDDPDPARALLPEDGPPASVIRRPG